MVFNRYFRRLALKRRSVQIASDLDNQFISNKIMPVGDQFAPVSEMDTIRVHEYDNRITVIKTIIFCDAIRGYKKENDIWEDILKVLAGHLSIRLGQKRALEELRRWDEALKIFQDSNLVEDMDKKNSLLTFWSKMTFGDVLPFTTEEEMLRFARAWLCFYFAASNIISDLACLLGSKNG
jgi:hypothetical protein